MTSDVVARAGGDEFVALIEGGSDMGAELSSRLRRRLAIAPQPTGPSSPRCR